MGRTGRLQQGKAGSEMFNATNDLTLKEGWQNSFVPMTSRYYKGLGATLLDGGFGILKFGTNGRFSEDFLDANIDQAKYQLIKVIEQ